MTQLSEQLVDGYLTLSDEIGNVLEIPLPKVYGWGHLNVRLNGERIPCARLWQIIADYMVKEEQVPRSLLMEEALRAELYRQLDQSMLIWTVEPLPGDKPITEYVVLRKEKQRKRPLAERFGITIGRLDGPVDSTTVQQLNSAAESLGLGPVAAGEDRVFYSKNPQEVFGAFGSTDWVRLYVYLKRPGTSSVHLDLRKL